MDTQMNINGDMVRALREEKSWSQEHLADAAGLSARTVQRVESEAVASAETRLALAAALGVPVSSLMPARVPATNQSGASSQVPAAAWVGWGWGLSAPLELLRTATGLAWSRSNKLHAALASSSQCSEQQPVSWLQCGVGFGPERLSLPSRQALYKSAKVLPCELDGSACG